MRGPASMRRVGTARLISAWYCMDSSETLASSRFSLRYSERTLSIPWRTRVSVIGFQVWMTQRRYRVAPSTRRGSILRSPSSNGAPKCARGPPSILKAILICWYWLSSLKDVPMRLR